MTPPTLLTKQRKIALVKRGNCTFAEKVIYSQMDGAVGVIIYDDIPFEKDSRAGLMVSPHPCFSSSGFRQLKTLY